MRFHVGEDVHRSHIIDPLFHLFWDVFGIEGEARDVFVDEGRPCFRNVNWQCQDLAHR